jgi:hypothetical protein
MKSTIVFTAVLLAVASPVLAQQGQGGGQPGTQFIENWDLSGNGHVNRDDFLERREDIFRMFDADENTFLENDDLQAIVDHLAAEEEAKPGHGAGGGVGGQGRGPGAAVHQAMTLEFNDSDGDGRISRTEFAAASERGFEMLDRDSDGKIDMTDFR